MKKTFVFLAFILLLALLAWPGRAQAAGPTSPPSEFVFGGNYVLHSGDRLNEDLVVFGGNAILQENSRVNGSLYVFGGNVTAHGEITGDINVLGGNVTLTDTAVVNGDVNTIGGSVNGNKAAVLGQFNPEWNWGGPSWLYIPQIAQIPNFNMWVGPLWNVVTFLFRVLILTALAVLVALLLPKHTERMAEAISSQPLQIGGIGCGMTVLWVLVAMLFAVLAITICLIPVSMVGFLFLGALFVFGWTAVGLEIGKRLARMLNKDWAVPVSAGVGTLLLTLIWAGIGELGGVFVLCGGWLLMLVPVVLALGSAVMTVFGTRSYPAVANVPAEVAAPTALPPMPPAEPKGEAPPPPEEGA